MIITDSLNNGTPTLHNFSINSPSDNSANSSIRTPSSSQIRANPFLPSTFQQRQDFNFVQEHFNIQPLHSPASSPWSATSPQSTNSSITTTQRTNHSSSIDTPISIPQVDLSNSLQPPRNTALSSSSFIPEIRLPSSHLGRTRSTPILNPNPPTRSRVNEHTYLFALDHKTWNPPPLLYGPTNLGDTHKNWSRIRLINTLNLTQRQRNTTLEVLATPSLALKCNTTKKIPNSIQPPISCNYIIHNNNNNSSTIYLH